VLDGLGDIGVAQMQHRIVAVVPPKEEDGGPLLTCWIDSTSMVYCNAVGRRRDLFAALCYYRSFYCSLKMKVNDKFVVDLLSSTQHRNCKSNRQAVITHTHTLKKF